MAGDTTLLLIRLFAIAVAVSAAVSLLTRRVALPYSVVLVACGLVAGAFVPLSDAEIPPELVLLVLLPGLIFEASYHIDLRLLRPNLPAIALLAGPGVVISAAAVAVALHVMVGMSLASAFVVGAIVSATDPAAVIASFRRLHAPRRLATLVEAESVFNDGTGIVVFTIAAAALLQPVPLDAAIGRFVLTVVVSIVVGFVAGQLGTRLIVLVDEHVVELAVSLLMAYGTYLVADAIHQSGIIATAVAGIVLGNAGRALGVRTRTLEALDTVWEFLAYLLTALVFLLIGLATPATALLGAAPAIAAAVIAALAARAVLVYGLFALLRRVVPAIRRATPVRWLHVVFWSGLRGAIAVALALSLSTDVPDRARIQQVAFGVVLFTLAVQATTADTLLRRLDIGRERGDARPIPSEAPGVTSVVTEAVVTSEGDAGAD